MADRILTLAELNRATLERQLLLRRAAASPADAVKQLVGLQAQQASAPYVGLWTRLENFRREDLARLIHDRKIVKATMMRSTLHLLTADDYVRFRTTLVPMFEAAWTGIVKQRNASFSKVELLREARSFLEEKPRSFEEISRMVSRLMPDQDVGAMRYAVRTHLPLVQVPVEGGWSYSSRPSFTLAEPWIGRELSKTDDLRELARRYLAAFGPASATDMQTWSGLKGLKGLFDEMRSELQTYHDERRRELFDLPDISLPDSHAPIPTRFLPEYDNLLLSHNNRTRIIADAYRSKVYLPGLRVRATFLVGGFVRGAWKIETRGGAATLVIEPFEAITPALRKELVQEAERLVAFYAEDAGARDVVIRK